MSPARLELMEAKRELRAAQAVLDAVRRMARQSFETEFLYNPPTMVHGPCGRPLSKRRYYCRGKVYVEVRIPETSELTPRLRRVASMMQRRWD